MTNRKLTHFDRLGAAFSRRGWVRDRRMRERLSAVFESFPSGIWLDVGCGNGDFASAIARSGVRIVGADLSLPMIRSANGSGAVDFSVCSDANQLPFLPETFEVTASRNVLKHCRQRSRATMEMVRVCKRNGWFVLVESCCADERDKRFMDELILISEPDQQPYLTANQWIRFVEDHGVRVQQSEIFRHRVHSTVAYRREQFGLSDARLHEHWLHFSKGDEYVRHLRDVAQRVNGVLEFDLLWILAAGRRF